MKNKYTKFIYIFLLWLVIPGLPIKAKEAPSKNVLRMLEKSKGFFNVKKDSTLYYSRRAVFVARRNNSDLLGKALYNLGYHYYRWSNMDSAQNYLEQCLKINKQNKDSVGLGQTLNLLGNVYWYQGEGLKSRKCFDKALNINLQISNHKAAGKSYNNLGNLFSKLSNYDMAINTFMQAREEYQKAGYLEGKAWLNYSISRLYKKLGDYEQALKIINHALSQYKKLAGRDGDSTGIMLCYD